MYPHLDELRLGRAARQLAADRLDVQFAARHRRHPVVVVAERDPARAQQVGLLGHELRERPLDGLAVDIAPSRRGEDGEVGAQVTQDSAPVPRRVLPEDATLRRLDQIGQRRAVASGALV